MSTSGGQHAATHGSRWVARMLVLAGALLVAIVALNPWGRSAASPADVVLQVSTTETGATLSADGSTLTFKATAPQSSNFDIAHTFTMKNIGGTDGTGKMTLTAGGTTLLPQVTRVTISELSPEQKVLSTGALSSGASIPLNLGVGDAVKLKIEFVLACPGTVDATRFSCNRLAGQKMSPRLSLAQSDVSVPVITTSTTPAPPISSTPTTPVSSPSTPVSSTAVTSTSVPPTSVPPTSVSPTPTPTISGSGHHGTPNHLSIFGKTFHRPSTVDWSAKNVGTNLGVTALLLMMIMFPAELFNNTLKENYEEVVGWFGPIRRGMGSFAAWLERLPFFRFFGALFFIAALGGLGLLLEGSGEGAKTSLRVGAGIMAGALFCAFLSGHVALLFARRQFGTPGRIRMRPFGLILALLCVVLSRSVGFHPGYLYGLVASFEIQRELRKHEDARVVIAWATTVFGFSLTAWAVLEAVQKHAESSHNVWYLASEEALVALAIEGLTGLALALLPIRFMEGVRLWDWSKIAWIAIYAVIAFAFIQLVVHPEFAGRDATTPLWVWLGLFVGFGLISVAFWAYFRFRHREEGEGGEGGEGEGEGDLGGLLPQST